MAVPAPLRSPRRLPALLVVLVVALLVAGCATAESFSGLTSRLRSEGFRDVEVTIDDRNLGVLVVRADAPAGSSTDEGQERAAEVVWDTFPRRIDALSATIDGDRRRWTYAEMEDEFGAREARLDRDALEEDLTRAVVGTGLGILAVGVLGLGLIGITVLVVTRRRRQTTVRAPVRPWMPPGHSPVPPEGGWPPPADAPPAGAPPADGPPITTPPVDTPPTSPPVPPAWVTAAGGPAPDGPGPGVEGRRRRDPEARRLGRRPPGRLPDATHTPPGWG